MLGKSILTNLLTFAIGAIALTSSVFSPDAVIWLSAISFLLTAVLNSDILKTGTLPEGWTISLWAINIGGIINQVMAYFGEHNLIPVVTTTMIIALINLFITTFLKDYGNGSRLVRNR